MSEMKSAVRAMGIAIDYDDTFTTCPETWTKVIELLRASNANVFCVTYIAARRTIRSPTFPVRSTTPAADRNGNTCTSSGWTCISGLTTGRR